LFRRGRAGKPADVDKAWKEFIETTKDVSKILNIIYELPKREVYNLFKE